MSVLGPLDKCILCSRRCAGVLTNYSISRIITSKRYYNILTLLCITDLCEYRTQLFVFRLGNRRNLNLRDISTLSETALERDNLADGDINALMMLIYCKGKAIVDVSQFVNRNDKNLLVKWMRLILPLLLFSAD